MTLFTSRYSWTRRWMIRFRINPPPASRTPPKRGIKRKSPPLEGCPKDGVGEGWSSGRGGLQEDATQGSGEDTPRSDVVHAANQFVDNEGQSIDEVRVEGNRRVRLSQIKDALEQGPDNIAAATQTMEAILPYVRRANWNIHEEGTRRIATITIEEQDAFSRQFHTVPFITAGFNRVHGFRLGPQFTLQSSSPFDDVPQGRLFGEASYGFSNHKINYKTGGSVSWNLRQRWDLTVSAQVHRLTTTRDADVLPDNGEQVLMALLYGGDFRDYYLREGSEVSLRWAHNNATHALGLTLLTEAHESLQKTTDWSFLRWKSEKEPNLSITAGQMRSVVLSYDFDGRAGEGTSTQGWYHSFSLEQGISAIGSDFHFTRFQAHLRRYQPLGDHGFDARLKIGLSTSDLPIQRQFILGGLGTLRGYDLFEFAGDQMVLANLEYRHKVFGGFFGVLFFDAGKVWDGINTFDAADAKASIGLGIQIDDGWRLNWAQALESGRSVQFHMRWSGMF